METKNIVLHGQEVTLEKRKCKNKYCSKYLWVLKKSKLWYCSKACQTCEKESDAALKSLEEDELLGVGDSPLDEYPINIGRFGYKKF